MPSKIDINLLPSVIRDSVDPEILARAQSIEWSILRDSGEDEHGFLDGSHEDYLSSQNLMHKTHAHLLPTAASINRDAQRGGRDSGLELSPAGSPAPSDEGTLRHGASSSLSGPLELEVEGLGASNTTTRVGPMKRHPSGLRPFPIYKVNQEQLEGDVVFEPSSTGPGEQTVHYERSQRAMSEQELNALGLSPEFFGPNSKTMMDEQEEELIETSVVKGGQKELERMYSSMIRTDASDYFDSQRIKSASQANLDHESIERTESYIRGSDEDFKEQHYGTWGTRHQEQKQWKLCNGQWLRLTEFETDQARDDEATYERYMAEKVRCKYRTLIRKQLGIYLTAYFCMNQAPSYLIYRSRR